MTATVKTREIPLILEPSCDRLIGSWVMRCFIDLCSSIENRSTRTWMQIQINLLVSTLASSAIDQSEDFEWIKEEGNAVFLVNRRSVLCLLINIENTHQGTPLQVKGKNQERKEKRKAKQWSRASQFLC